MRVLGYDEKKAREICYAISHHSGRVNLREQRGRSGESAKKDSDEMARDRRELLARIIALADQLSRNCFACEARESCKWKDEEKTTGGDLI